MSQVEPFGHFGLCLQHAVGKAGRLALGEWMIEQEQGLGAHRGHRPDRDRRGTIGGIEERSEAGAIGSDRHEIECAARAVKIAGRDPAARRVELTGHNEEAIADRLGFEPMPRIAAKVMVVRIRIPRVLIGVGRLPVGRRQQHPLVQLLQAPAIFHEGRGQVVEQFGMSGLLPQ